MVKIKPLWFLLVLVNSSCSFLCKGNDHVFSSMVRSFAPNSGGQTVYSLKYKDPHDYEYSATVSHYLSYGGQPLSSISMGKVLPLGQASFLVKGSLISGFGLSTAGPYLLIDWSVRILWFGRIDIATHFYILRDRISIWNLPLWLGISVPI